MNLYNNIYKYNSVTLIGALTSKPYAFSARSWELEKLDFIDFYDGMLSNISVDVRGLSIMRVLPRINESLNEEWISDKIRFSYDAFRRQRLLNPMFKNIVSNSFEELTWEEALFTFFFKYNIFNYDYLNLNSSLDAVAGNFLDLESQISFKDFLMSFKDSSVSLNYSDYGKIINNFSHQYLLNFNMSELSSIDFALIVSSNVRYENPVLHLKLLRLSNQGVPLFTFGCLNNLKFKHYSFGNSVSSLVNFIKGKSKYSILLSKSKKPVIFLGDSLKQRVDFSALFAVLNNLNITNSKISHVISNPSKISGLALGSYDNDLKSLIFKKETSDNIAYLYNADEICIRKDNYKYVIYQGHHGDRGSSSADLILPSTFLLERRGSFLNMEGKIVKYNFLIRPGSSVRTDWRIFKALTLYFKNNFSLIKNTFQDVSLNCLEYLPVYKSTQKVIHSFHHLNLKNSDSRINNRLYYSFYIEYFLSDSVSRASRVMSISAVKFKNYFYNF
jgi:NADH-quinone oxidoreductase subunit G